MRLQRFLATGRGAGALAICAGTLAVGAAGVPSSAATTTASAPVIQEKFTVLPCPRKPTTTVQIEGCAEHRVLGDDQEIDAINANIFVKLKKPGRAAFTQANADWVKYRNAACTTEASIYSGGSVQPIAYANCLVSIDSSHVNELKKMLVALSPAG